MNPTLSYVASAVPHPEIPDGYWGRFSLKGQPAQWITDERGARRIFATKEAAELAAARSLIFWLNGGGLAKTRSSPKTTARPALSERDRVFAKFKGTEN